MPKKGISYAIVSAILFALTTPLAKSLLSEISPALVAGLFYLGSGCGLMLYWIFSRQFFLNQEPSIKSKDWLWFAPAILAGGVLAPILLMFGLQHTQATSASLFLNLEGVMTAMLAWFIFKENYDRRIILGMLFITVGGIILCCDLTKGLTISPSMLLICAACLCWAIDNNFTRKLSTSNPVQIALCKGLVAGLINTAIALSINAPIPHPAKVFAAMLIGFLGYGASLVLYILALRHIGTARTSAYFASAPFIGALFAIFFLHEAVTIQLILASFLMAGGLWLHLTEKHSHEHIHEEMEHEHIHVHDEHHQHTHNADDSVDKPHSHLHKHERMIHSHMHFPDLHHDHDH